MGQRLSSFNRGAGQVTYDANGIPSQSVEVGPPAGLAQQQNGASGSWAPTPGASGSFADTSGIEPSGSMKPGHDTYNKTPGDWAMQFPAPGQTNEEWDKFKATLGGIKTMKGKAPPAKSFPKGEVPQKPEEVLAAAAIANTPSDDQGMKELGRLIEQYESGKNKKLDLSPILALTDAWTGSNLVAAYDRPMNDEEREKIVIGLRSKFQEHKDNLAYKKDYMVAQSEAEKSRQRIKAVEQKEARDLKLKLANINAGGRAAKAENNEQGKLDRERSKYLRENKKALLGITAKRYGSGNPEDKSHELRMGPLNDEIYEAGKHLEAEGQAKPGMGYNVALEWYLANSSGPDGAK